MTTEFDERLTKLESLVRKTMDELSEVRLQLEETRKAKSELDRNYVSVDARYARLNDFMRNQIPELRADQTYMVINLQNRLGIIDRRLRKEASDSQVSNGEVSRLRGAIDALVDPILDDENLLEALSEINREIIQIEEKVS